MSRSASTEPVDAAYVIPTPSRTITGYFFGGSIRARYSPEYTSSHPTLRGMSGM
jgi:hypothetical protein